MGDPEALAAAAARYINAGLSVIALAGKAPNTAIHRTGLSEPISGTVEDHGDHPADSYTYVGCPGCEDRKALAGVFEHPETTGVGIVIPAHLVVVDIDGEEGAREYQRLVGLEVPDTPAAKTGRGLHLWYMTPREQGSTKLGEKLDLKGLGGYVAAPPSLHPDGHVYTWLDDLVVDGRVQAAWLPDGIERVLADMDAVEDENTVERPVYTLYNLSLQDGAWRLRREVCPPPIDGLIRSVREAPEGKRNNMLAWAVLQARDEGLKMEDALSSLGEAAIAAGLTRREVRTTIRSAYRRSRREAHP